LLGAACEVNFLSVAGAHDRFWQRYPGLVWSNPDAGDGVRIRAALLRPRFDRLLEVALEFGLEHVKKEWGELREEGTAEALRAANSVARILNNIEEGFSRAAARN